MTKHPPVVLAALCFTLAVFAIGSVSFGIWTALIFLIGYLGGFLLWLRVPATASFSSIKVPYFVTIGLFVVHRVDEYVSRFQEALSGITGVPVPEVGSLALIVLLVMTVVAWLLTPLLVARGYAFGYFLAWTFFFSMGVSELAHFAFPLFGSGPYGYFPGMASVLLLAPAAWLGMWRLVRNSIRSRAVTAVH